MARFPSAEQDKFMLRLPDGMRDQLKEAAVGNRRSMNAELIARLEVSFETATEATDMAKSNAITVRLSDETREKLDRLSVAGPYRISITSIIERGIELAAQELEALNAGRAK